MTLLESDESLRERTLGRTDNPEYRAWIARASGTTLEALAWMYGVARQDKESPNPTGNCDPRHLPLPLPKAEGSFASDTVMNTAFDLLRQQPQDRTRLTVLTTSTAEQTTSSDTSGLPPYKVPALARMASYVATMLGHVRRPSDAETAVSIMLEDPSYWRFHTAINEAVASGVTQNEPPPDIHLTQHRMDRLRLLNAMKGATEQLRDLLRKHTPEQPSAPTHTQSSWTGPPMLAFMEDDLPPKIKRVFLNQLIGGAALYGFVMLQKKVPGPVIDRFFDLAIEGERGNISFLVGMTNLIPGLEVPTPPDDIEPLNIRSLVLQYGQYRGTVGVQN